LARPETLRSRDHGFFLKPFYYCGCFKMRFLAGLKTFCARGHGFLRKIFNILAAIKRIPQGTWNPWLENIYNPQTLCWEFWRPEYEILQWGMRTYFKKFMAYSEQISFITWLENAIPAVS
jgi:hypothetical protein